MDVISETVLEDGGLNLEVELSEEEEEVLLRIGAYLLYGEKDYNNLIQAAIEYVLTLQILDAAEK